MSRGRVDVLGYGENLLGEIGESVREKDMLDEMRGAFVRPLLPNRTDLSHLTYGPPTPNRQIRPSSPLPDMPHLTLTDLLLLP